MKFATSPVPYNDNAKVCAEGAAGQKGYLTPKGITFPALMGVEQETNKISADYLPENIAALQGTAATGTIEFTENITEFTITVGGYTLEYMGVSITPMQAMLFVVTNWANASIRV